MMRWNCVLRANHSWISILAPYFGPLGSSLTVKGASYLKSEVAEILWSFWASIGLPHPAVALQRYAIDNASGALAVNWSRLLDRVVETKLVTQNYRSWHRRSGSASLAMNKSRSRQILGNLLNEVVVQSIPSWSPFLSDLKGLASRLSASVLLTMSQAFDYSPREDLTHALDISRMAMRSCIRSEDCAGSNLQLDRVGFELCKSLTMTAVPLLGLVVQQEFQSRSGWLAPSPLKALGSQSTYVMLDSYICLLLTVF